MAEARGLPALKPPGAWYAVVLRGAADFGTRCACCDRETPARRTVRSVAVPVCKECEAHVRGGASIAGFALAALVLPFAGMLLLLGLLDGWYGIAALGGVMLALSVAPVIAARARRRRSSLAGHHAGLEIDATGGYVGLRTTNRRLAIEVSERNRDLVTDVR